MQLKTKTRSVVSRRALKRVGLALAVGVAGDGTRFCFQSELTPSHILLGQIGLGEADILVLWVWNRGALLLPIIVTATTPLPTRHFHRRRDHRCTLADGSGGSRQFVLDVDGASGCPNVLGGQGNSRRTERER
jgi:hypothetical protein